MPISIQCSGCGGKFRAPDELAGKMVKCPKCSIVIRIGGISQRQAGLVGEFSVGGESGHAQMPHPSPFSTPATPTASQPAQAAAASGGATLKNRLFSGLLLVGISALAFFWSSMFDGHFFPRDEGPQLRLNSAAQLISVAGRAQVAPEALLTYTFVTLGILCAAAGLLLLTGGPVASRLYSAIGLAQEPQREMRLLSSVLQLCAVWHLSIGWLISEMETRSSGGEVIRVFWLVVVFGAVPGALAPFCLRGERWSLWTILVISVLVFLIYTIGFVYLVYQCVTAKLPLTNLLDVPIIYWILTGFLAFGAWWSLRHLRSVFLAHPAEIVH